ncbi:hypothetical protein MMC07_009331, partial [Pseudocyphellaria aurata]|nr:hypothetical protein [Pseudocyphellaria aurata]
MDNFVGVEVLVIARMSVVKSFLQRAWTPHQALVLAFGFDEEIGGVRGVLKSLIVSRSFGSFYVMTSSKNSNIEHPSLMKIDSDCVNPSKNYYTLLEDTWDRDKFAIVLDESGIGLTTMGHVVYA